MVHSGASPIIWWSHGSSSSTVIFSPKFLSVLPNIVLRECIIFYSVECSRKSESSQLWCLHVCENLHIWGVVSLLVIKPVVGWFALLGCPNREPLVWETAAWDCSGHFCSSWRAGNVNCRIQSIPWITTTNTSFNKRQAELSTKKIATTVGSSYSSNAGLLDYIHNPCLSGCWHCPSSSSERVGIFGFTSAGNADNCQDVLSQIKCHCVVFLCNLTEVSVLGLDRKLGSLC